MIGLFRWMFGYVRFVFTGGFAENFLTECFADGIELRNVKQIENGFAAYCNVKVYKKLHHYAFRHGGRVKIIKKSGLPFVLLPLKNRVGFFVGALAFIIIVSFLSCFVWNVELVGNDRISDTAMEAYLENHNFKSGVMWSSVDRDLLSWDIMSEFDDISWVHINKTGTTARVEINETRLADKDGDAEKLMGINVMRKELQTVAYREQKDMTVRDRKTYKRIKFFFADIPLYFDMQQGDISNQSEHYLTIRDTVLPIGIIETEESFLSSTPKMLSDEELIALAEKKLAFSEEKELDGFEIINKAQEQEMDDDKCVITASYIVKRK